MPRHKRLDCPGIVHHVIVRGIERRKIFRDENDHEEFLERLRGALEKTKCRCYAWALMGNHFHLLIRTGEKPLSDLMRSLQTGYAIYFNKRYRRLGYLYQNRYKSILCQEDTYFLELVRYIHLNPIRANVIGTLKELDRYPWTGHSVLMGRKRREWQTTEEVLVQFGKRRREAIQRYRQFIKEGMGMGRREDLMGGGLKRSAGGWDGIQRLRKAKEFWRGDERILGDGGFVNEVLKRSEESLLKRERLKRDGWDLKRLIQKVSQLTQVLPEDVKKRGRENEVSKAKGLIAFWGYHELGLSGKELMSALGITRPALSQAIERGEKFTLSEALKLID